MSRILRSPAAQAAYDVEYAATVRANNVGTLADSMRRATGKVCKPARGGSLAANMKRLVAREARP